MAHNNFKFRETELRRALRAFGKERIPVQGARILCDGSIQVIAGKPEDEAAPASETKNEWDGEYGPPSAA
jgi:hypothetical protein